MIFFQSCKLCDLPFGGRASSHTLLRLCKDWESLLRSMELLLLFMPYAQSVFQATFHFQKSMDENRFKLMFIACVNESIAWNDLPHKPVEELFSFTPSLIPNKSCTLPSVLKPQGFESTYCKYCLITDFEKTRLLFSPGKLEAICFWTKIVRE